MKLFAFFRRKTSTEQIWNQGVEAELKSLQPFYPPRELFIPKTIHQYPAIISLIANGYGAYLLKAHVTVSVVSQVARQIADIGFLESVQSDHFQTYRQGQEAVSLQTEALGEGVALVLVSNSTRLLQVLPNLAPPEPWQVFPDIDALGLGSLQGSVAHWWQCYWWPYWQSLSQEQRNEWLHNPAHPEAWREYVQLQEAFADNDTESPS
ncbi:hypothetical protein DNK06_17135 [Pseudomonas daroniae]|uniref:Uncharacterized protein n=1 Tax=Phytopseudomonas daroniae TaxID=2487519 RepID=A0A4Q9QIX5_9GAMM|nr:MULTISPECIES: hypothetical protein [Pseudomonas]TBU76595.1 hypothetical protein DNK06_17135 [Pseudomonas daroniae]TBU80860.1 hypothetical protein DNK31_15080 [Pseudomonas sp. FRB 228]TBU90098.1 hypothetical protein DNJ99_13970 [Pseudomonas daroniae]